MTELRNAEADASRFRLRALVVALVVLLAFGLLVWRLYFLQVERHEDLAEQAESNRTAVIPVVPHRGHILDRNGIVLATNYAANTLEITPSRCPTWSRPSTPWPKCWTLSRATGGASSGCAKTRAALLPSPSATA